MQITQLNRLGLALALGFGLACAGSAPGMPPIALGADAAVEADPDDPAPPGGIDMEMVRFYTTGRGEIGHFPGTLVCYRDDGYPAAAGAEPCGKNAVRAIKMKDMAAVHPLIPANDETHRQMRRAGLQGAPVTVHGKYYPSLGMILANEVTPRAEVP